MSWFVHAIPLHTFFYVSENSNQNFTGHPAKNQIIDI